MEKWDQQSEKGSEPWLVGGEMGSVVVAEVEKWDRSLLLKQTKEKYAESQIL